MSKPGATMSDIEARYRKNGYRCVFSGRKLTMTHIRRADKVTIDTGAGREALERDKAAAIAHLNEIERGVI